MDREALLDKLGLTNAELQDFLLKFSNFRRELNPAQLRVLIRSLPTLEQARKSLGPTDQDLTELFQGDQEQPKGVVIFLFETTGGGAGN